MRQLKFGQVYRWSFYNYFGPKLSCHWHNLKTFTFTFNIERLILDIFSHFSNGIQQASDVSARSQEGLDSPEEEGQGQSGETWFENNRSRSNQREGTWQYEAPPLGKSPPSSGERHQGGGLKLTSAGSASEDLMLLKTCKHLSGIGCSVTQIRWNMMFECILISSFETLKTSKREVRRCLSVSLSVTLAKSLKTTSQP